MKLRILLAAAAGVSGLLLQAAGAVPAAADHETRVITLQESGLSLVLVALVVGGAILLLVAFAAAILYWERRDEETERLAQQADQTGGDGDRGMKHLPGMRDSSGG